MDIATPLPAAAAAPPSSSSSSSSSSSTFWSHFEFEFDPDDVLLLFSVLRAALLCLLGWPSGANSLLVRSSKQASDSEPLASFWPLLLWCGANPNSVDYRGNTILTIAIQRNLPARSALLLAYGANPSLSSSDGYGPLHSSVVEGSSLMVDTLLTAGANPFEPGAHDFTPLHTAVAGGRFGLVNQMIQCTRDRPRQAFFAGLNSRTSFGQTALHLAAHEAHINSLLLLLHAGCEVSPRDFRGRTPLDLAIQRGHLNCVVTLLKAGALRNQLQYPRIDPEIQLELEKWSAIPPLRILAAARCREDLFWTGKPPQNVPEEVLKLIYLKD